MRFRLGLLSVAAVLAGLAASIASLVDTVDPTFCSESGCATVRSSAWAHPLGVPLPVVGIAMFGAMLVLAFVARPRLRVALALVGGAGALGLIGLQAFVIGAWCKLCLVADISALLVAVTVLAGAETLRPSKLAFAIVAPSLAAAVLVLRVVTHAPPPAIPADTPAFVAAAQVPGKLTLVEIVDFECPFCRAFHHTLAAALERAQTPVHVVRKMLPLPQHPHAMAAALAYCCAEAQGKGDAMAAALLAADPKTLTPDGCEQLAARVGCDMTRYRAELPAMVGRVAADMLDARAAGIRSLPTTFVGMERLVGAKYSESELVAKLTGRPAR